jgi:glycosyltransferase involved in cell wall biosynthesis
MTAGASRFAVVVPWWVDRLSRAGIAKQAIAVPNVVERSLVDRADEPPASSGGGTCVFFTACRLVDGKGVSRLLRASAKCAQPLRLVIAGDGPKRAELESLAKDLDLQDQVEFAGWLDKVQLQSLRDRSDVFVLVSTLDSFGMGYIEAAASGIPAIGAHWQAIPDVVAKDEVGLLVDPTDLGALAAAMDRLAADADLRAVLGMRGQESVHDRWSPESRVRLVQDVLSQTAGLGSASDGRLLW